MNSTKVSVKHRNRNEANLCYRQLIIKIMYKVVSVTNKDFELYRGTYDECNQWAMNNFHSFGYMQVLPL